MSFPEARPSNSARYKPVECSKSVTTASVEYCFWCCIRSNNNNNKREKERREERGSEHNERGSPFFHLGKKEIKSNHIKHRSKNEKRTRRVPRAPREHCLLLVRKRTPRLCVKRTPKRLCFAKFASLSIWAWVYTFEYKMASFLLQERRKKGKTNPFFLPHETLLAS
jgi:hypothetical protein